MKTTFVSAAVCAAFFMAPTLSFADEQTAAPLVLAKETVPAFALEDFPWGLPEGRTKDVTVPMGQAVMTMPWMDVEKSGEESVVITAPKVLISDDSGLDIHEVATLTDVEMLVRRRGEAMVATGYAKTFIVSGKEKDGSQAQMDGFEFSLTASGYDLALAAMEAKANSNSKEFTAAMRALNLAVDYSVASSRMTIKNPDREGVPFGADLSTGPSDTSLQLGDGRIGFSVEGAQMTFASNGPFPIEGEIRKIAYDASMPTEESKSSQPMQFGFELSDVTLSDSIWILVDPGEIFPREFKTLKLDAALDVILNESMFDNPARRRGAETLEPVALKLTELELDGLGLDVSGNADIELNGDLPKSVSAFLSVAGLSEFMANAVKAGFVPQAQAIMGEGIALQFAKEEDDGSLTFDVTTESGMVSINGNRLAPLPQ